ncbi:hypothetical protein [Aquiflexum gelatinilyticum]|uniref:hypothetical protein n=1 Tax=Aquiflexum gelatinilyticum TaxID=2961943 RepID=UPI0021674C61|nr:hypothetical protein [Aquiflexum gelatinilyticum]MCS4436818.1 hypothetical protein [Aquiflexum gelatinilyticum]
MKNLKLYYAVVCVLFLMGCEQESQDNFSPDPTTSMDLQMNSVNEEGKITSYSTKDFPASTPSHGLNMSVSPNLKVTGNFRTEAGSKYNFAAVQDSDGVTGEWQVNSPTIGHFYMNSICVSVDGNESTIAGIVTEVVSGNFQENWIVFIKVKDNGEGVNAPSDQSTLNLYFYPDWFNFYPSAEAFLVDYSCSRVGATLNFGPFIDRIGQIQVR